MKLTLTIEEARALVGSGDKRLATKVAELQVALEEKNKKIANLETEIGRQAATIGGLNKKLDNRPNATLPERFREFWDELVTLLGKGSADGRIAAYKLVRSFSGINLKESKKLVDALVVSMKVNKPIPISSIATPIITPIPSKVPTKEEIEEMEANREKRRQEGEVIEESELNQDIDPRMQVIGSPPGTIPWEAAPKNAWTGKTKAGNAKDLYQWLYRHANPKNLPDDSESNATPMTQTIGEALRAAEDEGCRITIGSDGWKAEADTQPLRKLPRLSNHVEDAIITDLANVFRQETLKMTLAMFLRTANERGKEPQSFTPREFAE